MSDFRAIGGVSASLQALLQDRMEYPDGLDNVPVTVGTPRFGPDDNPTREDARVNLFLYRVSENGYLQNQEIPGSGSSGAYGFPPLSLNLHYLLTASGNQPVSSGATQLFNDTRAHFLLGSAMRVFHDFTVLTDGLLTARAPVGTPMLHESLRNSYEKVKLTLEPLSLEDVTKVWMALSLRYRLSAAYSITVVQIESKSRRTFPRLVGAPPPGYPPLSSVPPVPGPYIPVKIYSNPFIENIHVRPAGGVQEGLFPYARVGDTLILLGSNFSCGQVSVVMENVEVTVMPMSSTRIEVIVPDAVVPPTSMLQPGPRVVAVKITDPSFPQGAVRSNDSVFMVVPGLASAVFTTGRRLQLTGSRLYSDTFTGEAMVGATSVDKSDYSTASPTQITLVLPNLLPARNAPVLVSNQDVANPLSLASDESMTLTVGSASLNVLMAAMTNPTPLSQVAQTLGDVIQNTALGLASPVPSGVLGMQVGLAGNRLMIVAGDLTTPVTATGPLATTLALTGTPTGAYFSGDLSTFHPASAFVSGNVGLSVTFGSAPSVNISFPAPGDLPTAASSLQTALQTVSPGTMVGIIGTQLVIVPGAPGTLTFGPTTTDSLSLGVLQLQGSYGVRVRVNGAESLDNVNVNLPQ